MRLLFLSAAAVVLINCSSASLDVLNFETKNIINMTAAGLAPPNFSWIEVNRLAAMGYPRTVENVAFIVRQGIEHLVTLSAEKIPPIEEFPHLEWTLINVDEFEAPSLAAMVKFIDICTQCRAKNQSVGVHCRQGLGRTGVMAAIYLVRFQGLAPDEAVESVRRQRPWSIETHAQEKAVVAYQKYLQSGNKDDL